MKSEDRNISLLSAPIAFLIEIDLFENVLLKFHLNKKGHDVWTALMKSIIARELP